MNEALQATIREAESAFTHERGWHSFRFDYLIDTMEPEPGDVAELVYLATLLDYLGYRDYAARVLRRGCGWFAGQPGGEAVLYNAEGMLAANHGNHDDALAAFSRALELAQDNGGLRAKILSNLAATSLRAGHTTDAQERAASAAAAHHGAADAAIDVLAASVAAGTARLGDDVDGLNRATAALREASQRRIAELGPDHPLAVLLVANLATAEIDLARAEGSPGRLRSAIGVLEAASCRLAAELGADHPQSLAACANLASAEMDLARAEEAPQRLERATDALKTVFQRAGSALGAEHPHTVALLANIATAELELARAESSADGLREAVDTLASATDLASAVLGRDHPDTLRVLANLATAELDLALAQGSVDMLAHAVDRLTETADQTAIVLGVGHPVSRLVGGALKVSRSLLEGGLRGHFPASGTTLLVEASVDHDWGTREEYVAYQPHTRLPASSDMGTPHAVPDRSRARELFERLAGLANDDEERLRIRSELVELHQPLVEYLARRFRNRGEWVDDLTQVATIGLIKAIDRFDLARGVEFSTYATPTIVGEIKRHFRDRGWAVRVPRRLQELKLALSKAISDLAQREGRAPTLAEIAAHLQMSEEEVMEGLESANVYSTASLDAPDSGDDTPAATESLGMLDEALEGVEYRESLKPLLEQLPSREKRILLLRFFGNMTQSQIASELGISQMHVSRLIARTLAQLREGLTADE
jgi:RNA polymerase sigma-B factor